MMWELTTKGNAVDLEKAFCLRVHKVEGKFWVSADFLLCDLWGVCETAYLEVFKTEEEAKKKVNDLRTRLNAKRRI